MVDLSVSAVFLEYVCPALGMVICQFMFSAPFWDLQEAIRRGHLGDLNPTPWAFMLGNCFGWVTYGILKQNLFIFWANAPGFLLSVYLNLGAVKLIYQGHHARELRQSLIVYLEDTDKDQQSKRELRRQSLLRYTEDIEDVEEEQIPADAEEEEPIDWATAIWNVTSQTTPAPAPHETLVLGIVTVWTICISLLGFAQSFDSNTQELIVGCLVNLNLIFFYGAPLSTIYTVMANRNAASIHIPTLTTNTLNGTFWTVYGFAVNDPFIYVPNGLGALLGAIQIALIVIFPRTRTAAATTTDGGQSEQYLSAASSSGKDRTLKTLPESTTTIMTPSTFALNGIQAPVATSSDEAPSDLEDPI